MIIDISQEVFSCKVFPGDPSPEREVMMNTDSGDICNLTKFTMCAHNGTHVDAPFHFYGEGRTIDQMELEAFVGRCYVARHEGDVTADDAREILKKAVAAGGEIGHVFPQGACFLRHGQEERFDLLQHAVVFAVAEQDLQPQVIADESV